MTVYVDDMRAPARVGRLQARWSHLMADSRAELIEFARRIGLRDSWIQNKPSGVHYDVTDPKRFHAIRAGAVPIECGAPEWMRLFEAARAQYQHSSPRTAGPCGCAPSPPTPRKERSRS